METFLVGYGTLLNQGSLGQTIGHDSARTKKIIPVVVRGYRRLFNLRPTHYQSSSKLSKIGNENGAMNVESARGHHFNGLGFSVTPEELTQLNQRERYYECRSIQLYSFDSDEPLGEGHVYSAQPNSTFVVVDPQQLMPLWRDIVWARAGAYRISEAFGRMFDETTYLADGKTLVIDVYRDFLRDVSDVDLPG